MSGRVASLPKPQRCWHDGHGAGQIEGRRRIASETPTLLARAHHGHGLGAHPRRIASETPTLLARPSHGPSFQSAARRIASETPTLLAQGVRTVHDAGPAVASLPKPQRCWHTLDVNSGRSRASRIASETPTLLAPSYSLWLRTCWYVASLPKLQRCWHYRAANCRLRSEVASLPKHQRARGEIRDQGHRINSYANTRMPATDRVSCVRETTYGEVPLKTK